ncbi:hypothetical protein GDO78_010266 [Eleutherodactylus coqui]|uniref:Kunitz-type protease inhibitor 1 n=1 Tax=Eleutherodactylus coqui TaxID=57060 RepID=A0A8J6F3C6_ELECQ|nr:hypothetical protein GDO78_010266 [Eleutherodactylus coqui]
MRFLVVLVATVGSFWLVCSERHGQSCLDNFTRGMPNFVLELNDSVSSGATFLTSPNLDRVRDCLSACCRVPFCNLALVEREHGQDDIIKSCFLLNCVYQKEFVCKFVRKEGFVNYLMLDVSSKFLHPWENKEGDDDPPLARVSRDVKTQPNQEVTLSGIESWDKEGIVSYEWSLLSGDPDVVYTQVEDQPAYLQVSNLLNGQYSFVLVVTDTTSQQSSATVTITVLTQEETEEYCLAPKKVGRCRGSFLRWHYNPAQNECEEFVYGGCNPNRNNYVKKEDCRQTCVNSVCNGKCLKTQFRCADGCCIDAALECDDTQNCDDNSDEASCENYDKEFQKLQELDVPNNKGSAQIAIAVFLGICIMIVLAVIGYCILKKKRGSRKRQANVNNPTVPPTEDTEHLVYNRTTKPV